MQPRHRIDTTRSSKYSQWHSGDLKFGPGAWAYTTDIDFIEVTYLPGDPDTPIPVAVIEEKQYHDDLRRLQRQLYPMLAQLLNVPFYILRHNLETEAERRKWLFEVERYDTGVRRTFGEEQMVEWLWQLRKRTVSSHLEGLSSTKTGIEV